MKATSGAKALFLAGLGASAAFLAPAATKPQQPMTAGYCCGLAGCSNVNATCGCEPYCTYYRCGSGMILCCSSPSCTNT